MKYEFTVKNWDKHKNYSTINLYHRKHYISDLFCIVYIFILQATSEHIRISNKNICGGLYEYTTSDWCNSNELNTTINMFATYLL